MASVCIISKFGDKGKVRYREETWPIESWVCVKYARCTGHHCTLICLCITEHQRGKMQGNTKKASFPKVLCRIRRTSVPWVEHAYISGKHKYKWKRSFGVFRDLQLKKRRTWSLQQQTQAHALHSNPWPPQNQWNKMGAPAVISHWGSHAGSQHNGSWKSWRSTILVSFRWLMRLLMIPSIFP